MAHFRWGPLRSPFLAALLLVLALPVMAAAVNWTRLTEPWPDPASLADIQGVPVSWPSSSPFAIEDIGGDPDDAPPTTALGRFYLPPGPHAARSVPAVVLLHGSGGVLASRHADLIEFARAYRNYGKPDHRVEGSSHRMSEFTAAIGLVQLERLAETDRVISAERVAVAEDFDAQPSHYGRDAVAI